MADGGLRKLFRLHLPDFDWLSVETPGTERGVPDCNYCTGSREGWIEFKQCSGWKVNVRPEQAAWAERRIRKGGSVFLAVRRGQELWLFRGRDMRHLVTGRLDAVEPLGRWANGPSRWDWGRVRTYLVAPSIP